MHVSRGCLFTLHVPPPSQRVIKRNLCKCSEMYVKIGVCPCVGPALRRQSEVRFPSKQRFDLANLTLVTRENEY